LGDETANEFSGEINKKKEQTPLKNLLFKSTSQNRRSRKGSETTTRKTLVSNYHYNDADRFARTIDEVLEGHRTLSPFDLNDSDYLNYLNQNGIGNPAKSESVKSPSRVIIDFGNEEDNDLFDYMSKSGLLSSDDR
jgi:hypothetical protein